MRDFIKAVVVGGILGIIFVGFLLMVEAVAKGDGLPACEEVFAETVGKLEKEGWAPVQPLDLPFFGLVIMNSAGQAGVLTGAPEPFASHMKQSAKETEAITEKVG